MSILLPAALAALFVPLAQDASPPETTPSCHTPTPVPDAPLQMDRKSVLMRELSARIERSRAPFLGRGLIAACARELDELPASAPLGQRYKALLALGDARLFEGQIEAALQEYQRALDLTQTATDPAARVAAMKKIAIAWMRLGEQKNCVANHNQDSCLLPLREAAVHRDRTGSQEAIKTLQRVLLNDPNDFGSLWLMNVAHMTLGTWPDGVRPEWRIPASAFESEHPMPRMFDIAPKLGLNVVGRGGGSCMDDFDGDGLLDVVVASSDTRAPTRMFRQLPDHTFKDVTAEVGLAGQFSGLNFVHFDCNNDGRLDLMVQRGGWLGEAGHLPDSLWVQQPDGTFVDRTKEAGIEIAAPSQVAVVADVDLDGDLDLFLGYESTGPDGAPNDPSHLFRNRGDGTFEDVTERAGVGNNRFCKGAAFGDYDGDGRPDLYVSNQHGWNRLYHNDGDCRFTDVAPELGVASPLDSFACWFFDHDNDGRLDLFVTCYDSRSRADVMGAWYKNHATGFDTMRLYHNLGGTFRDVTVEQHLDRAAYPMGCNFGDIDNDGFPDLYLATGDPDFTSLWPNVMLRNDGGRGFQDVTTATGTGHLQKGHGVSFGDWDGDGDQDLFVEMGGAYVNDAFASAFFENPGHGNHWLTVKLVGHASNRFGVGARVRATIEEGAATRDVYAFVGANSSFGGNSLQAEMGLGQAARVVALEVFWPRTGATQRFDQVPLDRVVVVDEERGLDLVPHP